MFACIVYSIWPTDRILSDDTTSGQIKPGSNGNEGVCHIPQISKAGASLSDGLMPYLVHSLTRGFYHSAEMQSVYSTVPAEWADKDVSPKVNVKDPVEFELAYFEVIILHVSHYTRRNPRPWIGIFDFMTVQKKNYYCQIFFKSMMKKINKSNGTLKV